jgi:hypothetical protein
VRWDDYTKRININDDENQLFCSLSIGLDGETEMYNQFVSTDVISINGQTYIAISTIQNLFVDKTTWDDQRGILYSSMELLSQDNFEKENTSEHLEMEEDPIYDPLEDVNFTKAWGVLHFLGIIDEFDVEEDSLISNEQMAVAVACFHDILENAKWYAIATDFNNDSIGGPLSYAVNYGWFSEDITVFSTDAPAIVGQFVRGVFALLDNDMGDRSVDEVMELARVNGILDSESDYYDDLTGKLLAEIIWRMLSLYYDEEEHYMLTECQRFKEDMINY